MLKRKAYSFRLNDKENKILDELAEELDITRTAMIVRALRYYKKQLDKQKQKQQS